MEDEKMREKGPFLLREETHQLLFYLHWILLRGQPQAPGQPSNVGVDRDSFIRIKGVSQDDIGRLAADSGQLSQLFHRAGYFTPVVRHQRLGHADEAYCTALEPPVAERL